MPARDEAERIGACLRALAEQRGVSQDAYEVVVVLDGCRDATRERALEVGASHRSCGCTWSSWTCRAGWDAPGAWAWTSRASACSRCIVRRA